MSTLRIRCRKAGFTVVCLFLITGVMLETGCGISGGMPIAVASPTPTLVATATPALCPSIGRPRPADTTGWAVYRDTRFTFQVPIPPEWRAAVVSDGGPGDFHFVQIMRASNRGEPGAGASAMAGEIFEVGPVEQSAKTDLAPQAEGALPDLQPEPDRIDIGGVQSTLYEPVTRRYKNTPPYCGELRRMAIVDFGSHRFHFYMSCSTRLYTQPTYEPEKAAQDVALFLGMLRGFRYTGTTSG